jgi:hypothetical protein
MARRLPLLLVLLSACAGVARADVAEFTTAALPGAPPAGLVSPLALQSSSISAFGDRGAKKPKKARKGRITDAAPTVDTGALGAERARILLRSLTVPGWGQAVLGHRHSAAVFATAELGIWSAFTSFRIQEQMRRQSYVRTARLFAGIDVGGRDDEFRRIVGAFSSSDEYNLLVVARDAANIYLRDLGSPNIAGYRAYIAEHSLSGSDGWQWTDRASFDRYSAQRKASQRASLRANTALGLAIANRIVSALHAARAAGRDLARPARTSWDLDVTPGLPGEDVAFRAGVRARF